MVLFGYCKSTSSNKRNLQIIAILVQKKLLNRKHQCIKVNGPGKSLGENDSFAITLLRCNRIRSVSLISRPVARPAQSPLCNEFQAWSVVIIAHALLSIYWLDETRTDKDDWEYQYFYEEQLFWYPKKTLQIV